MIRTPIIAGNWKMNKTVSQALEFVRELRPLLADVAGVEVVICPPFTALYPVREELAGHDIEIALGAQTVFWKASGAYTSQISPIMLVDLGVEYVIIGHSEPRGRFGVPEENAEDEFYQYFGESDHTVNLKVKAALASDLVPILCVGETLAERQSGLTDSLIQEQLRKGLQGVSRTEAATRLVVAYEPVWAIGTGETCSADEANRVCGVIRAEIASLYDTDAAQSLRIQYGGSMKPSNAKELLAQEHIDGGLIGGASLVAADFAGILRAAG
jgi:triosephosphate isomerase